MTAEERLHASADAFECGLDENHLRALRVLSGAPALTDSLAVKLLNLFANISSPSSFVSGLCLCEFVAGRNGEWAFAQPIRSRWCEELNGAQYLAEFVHEYLLDVAAACQNTGEAERTNAVPQYLRWPVARAYHTAIFDAAEALKTYGQRTPCQSTREFALRARLSTEQQHAGVLPDDAVEPAFLRGMQCYRTGNRKHAERQFSFVAQSGYPSIELGISLHLLGVIAYQEHDDQEGAEELLRQSVLVLEAIGDDYGVAQTKNTLGNQIAYHSPLEAEDLLQESIETLEEYGDIRGEAMARHTLGRMLVGQQPARALEALRKSIRLLEACGDLASAAEVMNSLASQLKDADPEAALGYAQRSALIGFKLDLERHITMALNTLGQVHGRLRHWRAARNCHQLVLTLVGTPKDRVIALDRLSRIEEMGFGDCRAALQHAEECQRLNYRMGDIRSAESLEGRIEQLRDKAIWDFDPDAPWQPF